MGHLFSGSFDGYFGSLYLLWSVFINTDCNNCGQTSRLATGAQIQTSCNCKKDIHSYTCLLDCFCCWRTSFYSYTRVCSLHRYSAVLGHHNRRLLKDFLPSEPQPNSSDPPLTRRKPSNSNELSSIQKGSVQCTVGGGSIGRLLSVIRLSSAFIFQTFAEVSYSVFCKAFIF